jgi:hypothetical protein
LLDTKITYRWCVNCKAGADGEKKQREEKAVDAGNFHPINIGYLQEFGVMECGMTGEKGQGSFVDYMIEADEDVKAVSLQ